MQLLCADFSYCSNL